MSDTNEKILKVLENLQADVAALRTGQQTLQGDMQKQGKRLEALEAGQVVLQAEVKGLNGKVDTVELKVEAVHAYQKQAHDEIMGHLIDSTEIAGRDQKILEKRIERIEKHLGLPPLK